MLGPDSPEKIRKIVTDAATLFSDQIDNDLAQLAGEMDREILRMLAEKIAVMMLADRVNDSPEVPYISVWQSGKAEISQVYMSPRVVDLLGYSSDEVRDINFANLAGDRIVSFLEAQDRFESKAIAREKAAEDRREELLGNRVWKGFYRIKQKSGDRVWVMDKAALTKFINEKGNNVVYVSEGVLVEAGELMDNIDKGERTNGGKHTHPGSGLQPAEGVQHE